MGVSRIDVGTRMLCEGWLKMYGYSSHDNPAYILMDKNSYSYEEIMLYAKAALSAYCREVPEDLCDAICHRVISISRSEAWDTWKFLFDLASLYTVAEMQLEG